MLHPAVIYITIQRTLAVAMIWYLFDNAKNIRSRIDYIWKIS